VDWSYAGIAAIGEELVPLVGATLLFGDAEADHTQELDQIVFDGYVQGLRDAGWEGDPRLARLGYLAGLSIRYTLGAMAEGLVLVFDESRHAQIEQVWGRPVEELLRECLLATAQIPLLCQEVDKLWDVLA
jgi:hypothetical protein